MRFYALSRGKSSPAVPASTRDAHGSPSAALSAGVIHVSEPLAEVMGRLGARLEPLAPGSPSALVPPRVAADLAGLPVALVQSWIDGGAVRVERIRKNTYLSLDDVLRLASETATKGGGQ